MDDQMLALSREPIPAAEWVDENGAAALIGFAPGTLRQWRVSGRHGPPFAKFGRHKQGAIRYHVPTLRAWALKHLRE
jgi:hypothetical protein